MTDTVPFQYRAGLVARFLAADAAGRSFDDSLPCGTHPQRNLQASALLIVSTSELHILGARGSLPVSGGDFRVHGGATSSCLLRAPEGDLLLDAGSGLVTLATGSVLRERPAVMVFSHFHWDHVCGFAHLSDLYRGRGPLELIARPRAGLGPAEALSSLYRKPYFPIDPLEQATVPVSEVQVGESFAILHRFGVEVALLDVPHPGGASAIRLQVGRARVVYMPDVELGDGEHAELEHFCEGAELLVADSHFREVEYDQHRGWGHSTSVQMARFAARCRVGSLLLTHHAPWRTDEEVGELVEEARAHFSSTRAARQGDVVRVG